MINLANLSPRRRRFFNGLVIVGSVIFCLLLSLTRLPGMELLGIAPNWLLIWLVTWSVKRTSFQGTIAGLALGLIQDGMTSFEPSHLISLGLVGFLTARLYKHRYIQIISVVLIVFFMAIATETITAIQYSFQGLRPLSAIWRDYQQIALTSAILSSLWTPVIYYPLNRWWENIKVLELPSKYTI